MNRRQRRAGLKQGDAGLAEVERLFDRALRRQEAGRLDEALGLYRQVVRLAPEAPQGHYNLGLVLMQTGRLEEAVAAWREAIRWRPGYVRALNNLGIALSELDRPGEAEAALREALQEDLPETHNNLAIVLMSLDRLDEAMAHCRRALLGDGAYADGFNTLGILLDRLGRPGEAATAYRRALAIAPGFAKAHFNLGLVLLKLGELEEGWREHEWRWRGGARHLKDRRLPGPEWRGEALAGKRVLLHAEQGYGDCLQFVRFARAVAGLGGEVVLEAPAALVRLCRTAAGVAEVVEAGRRLPPFDRHLPLMSVPRLLGTTLADIPAEVPYLRPDPAAVEEWGRRLAGLPGRKVGLVWSGDPRPHDPKANAIDRRRSLALARLAPLLSVPGISMVSLQMGAPRDQLAELAPELRPLDVTPWIGDFADTAAAMTQLDLVISVDTAAAHLAGALGRPVWILSRFDGCWRWLLDRADSPWYPTARLFRQPAAGDWDDVIATVRDALASRGGSC